MGMAGTKQWPCLHFLDFFEDLLKAVIQRWNRFIPLCYSFNIMFVSSFNVHFLVFTLEARIVAINDYEGPHLNGWTLSEILIFCFLKRLPVVVSSGFRTMKVPSYLA